MADQRQEPLGDTTAVVTVEATSIDSPPQGHPGVQFASPWPQVAASPEQSRDGFDLALCWTLLCEGWRTILGIGVGVFVLVATWTLAGRMTFESSGELYLGDLAASDGDEIYLPDAPGDIVSEIEIIRSRSMVERAVLAAGLNAQIVPQGGTRPRYWRWLASGRDPASLDVAARHLLVHDALLAPTQIEPLQLSVEALGAERVRLTGDDLSPVEGRLGRPIRIGDAGRLVLEAGPDGPPAPGSLYDLEVSPLPEVYRTTQRNLQVTAPKAPSGGAPAKIVSFQFMHPSPRQAAEFVDQLMDLYLRVRQEWKVENASAAESFVSRQLQDMRKSLDSTQQKLAEFRAENDEVVLQGQSESIVEHLGDYESELVAARLEVKALARIKRTLSRRDAPVEAYMFGESDDKVLQDLGESLAGSIQALTDLKTRYQSDAPTVQKQAELVDAQRRSILNYVRGRLGRAQKNMRAIEGVIEEYEKRLKNVPGAEFGLAKIAREEKVYGKMYALLLEQQQQAAISKASTVSKNRILDAPREPVTEVKPVLYLRLAGSLSGVLLGALFVLVRGLLSDTLRSEQAARRALGQTAVLSCVPRRIDHSVNGSLAPHELIVQADRGYSEAFRTLRTNLYWTMAVNRGGAVVQVTSPGPGDGKTTCVFSLVATLAAEGKRVLVIDADLRKPSHHELTGLPRVPGLQELMSGRATVPVGRGDRERQVSWRSAVHTAEHPLGQFDCINAGDGLRPDLLTRPPLAVLLERARARYDFILVDSPACPLVSDALILAPLCDLVLSVVRVGHSTRRQTAQHVESLAPLAHLHAAVINGVARVEDQGYYSAIAALPVRGSTGPGSTSL